MIVKCSIRNFLQSHNTLLLALLLNIFFLIAYLILGSCKVFALDDYFMESVLVGAYGSKYDVHLYFINAIFGYLLKPFYTFVPSVGWYYIAELAEVFVAFVTYSFFILKKIGKKLGVILSLLLISCLCPDFYFQLNFTQCAEVLTIAGALWIVEGSFEKKYKWLFIGTLLFVAGYVMRGDAFLLGLPFCVAMFLYKVKKIKKLPLCFFVVAISCVGLICCLKNFNSGLYNNDPEYRYYAAYQGPRAVLGDGNYYNYETAYAELEERGGLGKNLTAARWWMFYDTETFALDSLRPLLQAINNSRYSLDYGKSFLRFLLEISQNLKTPNAWCWCILCLFLFFCSKEKRVYMPWLSLLLIALCVFYLLFLNRLAAYHVEVGIWLYATILLIPTFDNLDKPKMENIFTIKIFVLVSLLLSSFLIIAISVQPGRQKNSLLNYDFVDVESWSRVFDYAKENSSKALFLTFNQYKDMAVAMPPSYKSIKSGLLQNIYPLGYWNVNLPGMKRELELRNIQNPMRDVLKPNAYLIYEKVNANDFLKSYLEECISQVVKEDTVQELGNFYLIKYSIGENSR